jgi:hypothetical protein
LIIDKSLSEQNYFKFLILFIIIPVVLLLLSYVIVLTFNLNKYEWLFENQVIVIFEGNQYPACVHSDTDFYLKHCGFRYDLVWLILISYFILVMNFIFKKKLFRNLRKMLDDNVIDSNLHHKLIISFTGFKPFFIPFFILLFVFEIIFFISWWSPCPTPNICIDFSNISGIVSYVVIALLVIPIGIRYVLALLNTSLLLPYLCKKNSNVNIFHADKKGGFSPLIELFLYNTSILSIGIIIAYLLYPEAFNIQEKFLILIFPFVIINLTLFFLPQVFIYQKLSKERLIKLIDLHSKISYWYNKIIDIHDPDRESELSEIYNKNASPYKDVRDEINNIQVWPFDYNTFKFIIQFSLTTISLLFITFPDISLSAIIKYFEDLVNIP